LIVTGTNASPLVWPNPKPWPSPAPLPELKNADNITAGRFAFCQRQLASAVGGYPIVPTLADPTSQA